MRLGEADGIGVRYSELAPEFLGSGDFVARTRGIVGADIVSFALEFDAESHGAGLAKMSGERAVGVNAPDREAAVDRQATDRAEQRIDVLFVEMAQI